ncbi:MAG: glutamine--fructose-6-phosphate transaminase (isomerizing) [Actinobacteria bacterium]|nr:MAG: glutamine--fructose-6-phosphate transaminase (isomerizing) [Actinomycetota bacterium]
MCGIVGYIGKEDCINPLVAGLTSLEYRGYDSAGIAILNGDSLKVLKDEGKLSRLKDLLKKNELCSNIGIGHTRWATHGAPSKENAHPHTCCQDKIAVVHNGIIENHSVLREDLIKKGHKFSSETDTEIIAHLIEDFYEGDLKAAVSKAIGFLKGSFALVVMSSDNPKLIVTAKQDSPMVLGIGKNANLVASDIPALLGQTREMIIMDNGEMAVLGQDSYQIIDFDGNPVNKAIAHISWDQEAAEKGGFEDFMLKEIHEQPVAVRETLRGLIDDDGTVNLKELKIDSSRIKDINRVVIIACGTSYHAGLVGNSAIESWARIPVELDIASEFRYRNLLVDDKTLVIAITQSGETADTLAGLRSAKDKGAIVVAVTNVVGSSVTREADGLIYTHAGPEIGVAATKTFTSQIAALYVIALFIAQVKGRLTNEEIKKRSVKLWDIPELIKQALTQEENIKKIAQKYAKKPDFLFLGRGLGVPIALEGALKLKEISYIHAEGCAAGEMKHGPIALIDDDCPVVVVATNSATIDKVKANTEEVKARNAQIIAVVNEGNHIFDGVADDLLFVPEISDIFSPIINIIPLQLFAYYVAKAKGCNVDQPRNLAKSVTVE